MPFSPESFRSKHNKKLTMKQAKKAAEIANALLADGHDEASAIRIANAKANPKHKRAF